VTEGGIALYALADVCKCPEFVMATLPELAELGIVGRADVLPVPVGPQMPDFPPPPRTELEKLRRDVARLQGLLAEAIADKHRACDERDGMRERVSEPYGCTHCGITKRGHGRRWTLGVGYHAWTAPSEGQIAERMKARRTVRLAARAGELGRLRGQVAALLVERHSTNEALSDAAEQLRADRDRIAELEVDNAALQKDKEHVVKAAEARIERRRARLVKAESDLLEMRGLLSPNGQPRRIPTEVEIHERVAPAVEWLLNRVAELEAAQGTVFRAEHDSIPFGLYTTAEAAREHCEAYERRANPDVALDWIEDEEDGVAELVAAVGEEEHSTGYVVTALEVASKYDPDADE